MHTVSFAINYWSRGQVQGLFLRHEGYLGAIGAFLKGAEECGNSFLLNRFSRASPPIHEMFLFLYDTFSFCLTYILNSFVTMCWFIDFYFFIQ